MLEGGWYAERACRNDWSVKAVIRYNCSRVVKQNRLFEWRKNDLVEKSLRTSISYRTPSLVTRSKGTRARLA